jgi:hypothetical protein
LRETLSERGEKREGESEDKRERERVRDCCWDSISPLHVLNHLIRVAIPAIQIPFLGKKS